MFSLFGCAIYLFIYLFVSRLVTFSQAVWEIISRKPLTYPTPYYLAKYYVAKTKEQLKTAQLIYIFAYAKSWFSHVATHFIFSFFIKNLTSFYGSIDRSGSHG